MSSLLETAALEPNADHILAHLFALYAETAGDSNLLFEVRCLWPDNTNKEKSIPPRRFFGNEAGLMAASSFVLDANRAGYNIYSTPNLLKTGTNRDATDDDIDSTYYYFVDFDKGDYETFLARIQECGFTPYHFVQTGTIPTTRAHVAWRMAKPITDLAAWTTMQQRLIQYFETDIRIHNPSRIMRIGGGISYPTPKKITKDRYVTELTTYRLNEEAEPIDNEAFEAYFPALKEAPRPARVTVAANDSTPPQDVPTYVLDDAFKPIPPDDDRGVWLDLGYAAKEANPTHGGRSWDEWSRKSGAYDPDDQAKTWAGLKPSKITRATLFKMANDHDPNWWRDGDKTEAWWKANAAARSPDIATMAESGGGVSGTRWGAGFRMSDNGLWYQQLGVDKEGQPFKPIHICAPFEVIGNTADKHATECGLVIRFKYQNTTHEVIIANELLHQEGGSRLATLLGNRGLNINIGKHYRTLLQAGLGSVRTSRNIRSVKTTGWHMTSDNRHIFMMPDKSFIGEDKDVIMTGDAMHQFDAAGTLREWRDNVARYAAGNSRLILLLCTALTPPLIDILPGSENGGIHVVGEGRSGKTTGLQMGASTWGAANKTGCMASWQATDVALEFAASDACDCALFLDEIQSAPPKGVANTVYKLVNGMGRARGQKEGGYKKGNTWRIGLLSTGEMTASDKIREIGEKPMAGMEARLVNIPSDAGKGMKVYEDLHGFPNGGALSDHLRGTTTKYYGTAIRAFLKELVALRNEDEQWIVRELTSYTANFLKDVKANGIGISDSVAKFFAKIAFAGMLAKGWGILPETIDPSWALQTCFEAWREQGSAAIDGSAATIVKDVRRFIQAHHDSRFKPRDEFSSGSSPDHAKLLHNVVGLRDASGYYVYPEHLTELARHSEKAIAKALDDAGLLNTSSRSKTRIRVNGRRVEVYHIPPEIIEGDHQD